MVRSNFDYTNRTSSGERLGASIATDFLKKASQTAKPARPSAKFASKTKLSLPDSPSPARLPTQTKLDIKIPNKALTDPGLELVADALTKALQARSDLVLTDLNLSGNELTSASLLPLAQVLRHSTDIVSFDLSNNCIAINGKEALAGWEEFANACLSRQNLVKLDLSNNRDLGASALEAFARTGLTITDQPPLRRDSLQSNIDNGTGAGTDHAGSGAEMRKVEQDGQESYSDVDASHSSGVSPAPLKTTRTQALKVIDLQNTGLDERCALFSSTLMLHRPTRSPFNIQWHHNTATLGKDATNLMHLTQKLQDARESRQRQDSLQARFDPELDDGLEGDDESHDDDFPQADGSQDEDFDEDVMLVDVDRAIKKVQRNVIIEGGYTSVELWTAAMQVFVISRCIYALTFGIQWKTGIKTQPDLAGLPSPDPKKRLVVQPGVWATNITNMTPKPKQKMAIAGLPLKAFKALPPPRQAEVNASRYHDSVVKSNCEVKLHKHVECKAGASPTLLQMTKPTPPRQNRIKSKYLVWQERHLRSLQSSHGGASNGYRDPSLTCQLPLTACKRILSFSADGRSLSLLSERQQAKAFEWAQLHDSLKTEHDWRNRDKASQVWMLLEALECLEYDPAE